MKLNDQVLTPHGRGVIAAIETSKAGVRYGVLHAFLTAKLPRFSHADDIIYYGKEELQHA